MTKPAIYAGTTLNRKETMYKGKIQGQKKRRGEKKGKKDVEVAKNRKRTCEILDDYVGRSSSAGAVSSFLSLSFVRQKCINRPIPRPFRFPFSGISPGGFSS